MNKPDRQLLMEALAPTEDKRKEYEVIIVGGVGGGMAAMAAHILDAMQVRESMERALEESQVQCHAGYTIAEFGPIMLDQPLPMPILRHQPMVFVVDTPDITPLIDELQNMFIPYDLGPDPTEEWYDIPGYPTKRHDPHRFNKSLHNKHQFRSKRFNRKANRRMRCNRR